MKTLTEFSGTLLRMAAKAEAEAKKAIPKELLRVAPAQAAPEAVTANPSETASAAAPVPGADSASDAADQVLAEQAAGGATDVSGAAEGSEAKAGEAGPTADEGREGKEAEPETSAVKEILDKAVGEATGTTGDRLSRLREAVRAAGRQADRVRLVRVFGGEEEVAGAKKIGEFQYVVDLMPHSMKQTFEQKDDKKRGPRRPMGGGKNKDSGSLEGSFSMESVAQDRRSERGPGGGRPGGRGGPGGRPGGRGGPGVGRPGGRGGPGGGRGPGGSKPGGAAKS